MNYRLLIGSCLLIAMGLIALFGPAAAPYPVDYEEKVYYDRSGAEERMVVAPEAPSERHPFGSDPYGYDILTLLLYGARYTLMVCFGAAALRIGSGLLLVWVWFPNAPPKASWGVRGVSSLPVFLFVYFLLFGINFNPPVSSGWMASLQGSIIALIGIPHTFSYFSELATATRGREFVEAAVVSGAGHGRIFWRHILPQLREKIAIFFCHEIIGILNLIGQLGLFNIFIGGTRTTPYPLMFHSRSHEWAGLVGSYRGKILSADWWILGFPLAGFILLLLSLYLFTRGLEIFFTSRYRRLA